MAAETALAAVQEGTEYGGYVYALQGERNDAAHERDVLAAQVAAIRALPEWQDCNCAEDSPVGSEHHAARRGYNAALADMRELLASSPLPPNPDNKEQP